MNISRPFIRRPIATTLLAVGIFLAGAVAYRFLPVSSLPTVDLPTISVSASRPGADPATMAATVAAPIERRISEISGVNELTSRNSLGSSRIVAQFDLNRNVDGAARDVQAALNAALSDLPGDLPTLPSFRKYNPAAAPVLILAMTSKTIAPSAMYDIADSIIAQRISQVEGVGDVTVSGAEQPAIRVQVNPAALASAGVSMEQVRTAISGANALGPLGAFDGAAQAEVIAINSQLQNAKDYNPIVVKTVNGNVIRLSDVAKIEQGVRNSRSASWFNAQPAVLLIITKESAANVVETVQRIRDLLPELKRWIPADIQISVLSDRSQTIRSGIQHMQFALGATVVLVMIVVFVFLRRAAATTAAGVTVPLSLAGTCAAMWAAGFSLDNISLMALAVSVGFVVDDAIVMIENMFRNLERGYSPLRAALAGARQIGFTVVSISISLFAAFIPLLFMGGIVGRFFREFSVTLTFAIAISTMISLSVTPMICAHFVRAAPSKTASRLDRGMEFFMSRLIRGYAQSLQFVLHYRGLVLLLFLTTIVLTVTLYIRVPKGYFPQDDTGLMYGHTRAATDISFDAMSKLQQRATALVMADPAVAGVGSSVGSGGFNPSVNRGSLFVSLKPLETRGASTAEVARRLRQKVNAIPGLRASMTPAQDLRSGGRSSDATYQFTLWDPDIEELNAWVPKVVDRLQDLPELADVNTDRDQGGLQANVVIDRLAASRLGVRIQDIDGALNNAFSQRQVATIYSRRNQYRVVLEVDPRLQRDPNDMSKIFVPGASNAQVPLSSVAHVERGVSPLVINHQGQFPSVTISYDLAAGIVLEQSIAAIQNAMAEMHLPDTLHTEFSGDAQNYRRTIAAQPLLLMAALLAVYIVLGVLYESLLHPLTIISTLPSAGLGALLALRMFNVELTVIAFIGIILLIGLVKKNGIMLVDFALDGERRRGLSPDRAVFEACLARFRPIMMTTLAAILGAVPLVVATGPGTELRRPLGMTIIGGLLVSQILTLYTTPVIYLMLDNLRRRVKGRKSGTAELLPPALPAE
ncbi:MAG TPA: efflux RND transporter permease subunit [Xanthobacteraceae bacterium]|nr:efflux RND transporter permease subunit [Xanthobacteraceae bacterium]